MSWLHIPDAVNTLLPLLQQDPLEGMPPDMADPHGHVVMPSFTVSQILFSLLVSVGIQVLFGFWAKSKAEDHDANPWAAFALGFFLAYLGVKLVPLLRPGALFAKTRPPRPLPPRPAPGPYNYGQPVQPLPVVPPTQAMPPAAAPLPAAAFAMPPVAAVPIVDAEGYVTCPACGARAKAGRKLCMNCGAALPIVPR